MAKMRGKTSQTIVDPGCSSPCSEVNTIDNKRILTLQSSTEPFLPHVSAPENIIMDITSLQELFSKCACATCKTLNWFFSEVIFSAHAFNYIDITSTLTELVAWNFYSIFYVKFKNFSKKEIFIHVVIVFLHRFLKNKLGRKNNVYIILFLWWNGLHI